MREAGTVIRVDSSGMHVRLDEVARPEACRQCRACEVLGGGKEIILRVPALQGIAPGDRVDIEVPEANPWIGMLAMFALPLALMIFGLIAGSQWPWWYETLGLDPELSGAVLGVLLGTLAFFIARRIDRHYYRRVVVTAARSEWSEPPP